MGPFFNSSGPDGMYLKTHLKILKELNEFVAKPLVMIFENSLKSGGDLNVWRRAKHSNLTSVPERIMEQMNQGS